MDDRNHHHHHHHDSEDINEWQQIQQHQPSPENSPTTLHQQGLGWDMLVVNENYLQVPADQSSSTDDPPIHNQEGSSETVSTTTTTDTEDGTSSPSAEGAAEMTAAATLSDWLLRLANEGRKLLKLRVEAARNGVVRVASKVRECAVCAGAFWSVTCVAGAAAAAVLVAVVYVGIRRRRRRVDRRQSVEHLVYLLRGKDEKISQLLLQIAQLNEVLSSRRKVPVLRIGS